MEQEARINVQFLDASKIGDDQRLMQFLDEGADVNYADPVSGFTALHYAASRDARRVLKVLIARSELEYLVKDGRDRLPSALAFEIADNPVIGTFLMKKEIRHARERSIDYRKLIVGERQAPARPKLYIVHSNDR